MLDKFRSYLTGGIARINDEYIPYYVKRRQGMGLVLDIPL
jgi:hypothetical protein